LERKRALATDIVRNDADVESLRAQLVRILRDVSSH
jgi:dephospho-CoA kinase